MIVQAIQIEQVNRSSFFPCPFPQKSHRIPADISNILLVSGRQPPTGIKIMGVHIYRIYTSARLSRIPPPSDGAPPIAKAGSIITISKGACFNDTGWFGITLLKMLQGRQQRCSSPEQRRGQRPVWLLCCHEFNSPITQSGNTRQCRNMPKTT